MRHDRDKTADELIEGLVGQAQADAEERARAKKSERVAEAGVKHAYQAGLAIEKVRYTHDAMIDQIVANPWISQDELARIFGFTASWVSLVVTSDAFKERLEARKAELVDPTIRATINERLTAITTRSLEVLGEKLSKHSSAIPDNLALRAMELGLKGLGVGGNAAQSTQAPQANHLEVLAMRLVQLKNSNQGGNVYEGQVIVATP